MIRWYRSLTLNQKLQLVLVVALVVNAALHFTSSAYRFYERNFSELQKRQDHFEMRVQRDFVPAIYSIVSNQSLTVQAFLSSNRYELTSQHSSYSSSSFDLANTNSLSRLFDLDFDFFYFDKPGFRFQGQNYFAGDTFFGSTIRVITPTVVVTDSYQFLKPVLSAASFNHSLASSSSAASSSSNSAGSVSSPATVVVPQYPDRYFASEGE